MSENENNASAGKKSGSSKKKLIITVLLIVLIGAMVAVYNLWIAPISTETETEAPPELLSGESLGANNKIFIYDPAERSEIDKITVENPLGSYTLVHSLDDDSFSLSGNSGIQLNTTLISISFVPTVRYPLASQRIVEECDELEKYGLDEASRAKVTMKTTDGRQSVLYVGNALVNGGGYYCMTDGRSAVYQLDGGELFKQDARAIVSPAVALPLGDDYYILPHFELWRRDEIVVALDYMDEDERKSNAAPSTAHYKMTEPGSYVPSTANITTVYEKFQDFSGTEVLEMSSDISENLPIETLAKYGLDIPAYEIYYTYSGVDNIIFVSEQNPDGSYYVYSVLFSIIVKMDSSKLIFLEWELTDFVDRPVFQKNINDIATIEVLSDEFNETFSLEYTNSTLSVTPNSTKKPLGENSLISFKQSYAALLGISYETYADNTSTDRLLLTLKITTAAGIKFEYKFYTVSSMRCYYTVNGEGIFCTPRADIVSLIDSLSALMSSNTSE